MSDWSRPPVPKALDRLESFAGEWISRDEHAPTPWAEQGGTGQSWHRFRRALDGYCFISDFEGDTPFGKILGHGLWFYDRERERYRVRWYDNFANLLEGEGSFRGDGALVITYRYRMNGTDVDERHLLEPVGPDGSRLTIENVIDGDWRVASTQDYRRAEPGQEAGVKRRTESWRGEEPRPRGARRANTRRIQPTKQRSGRGPQPASRREPFDTSLVEHRTDREDGESFPLRGNGLIIGPLPGGDPWTSPGAEFRSGGCESWCWWACWSPASVARFC